MGKVEEIALEFYPKLFSERLGIDTHFEDRRIAFEHGYRKGSYDMLESVIEWLKENATFWMYIEPNYQDAPQDIKVIDGMYEVLRKEMTFDLGTNWEEVERRVKRSDKALKYMSENTPTRDEAEKQSEELRDMANGR